MYLNLLFMNRIKNKNYRIGCIIATIGVLAITLLLRNCFGQTWNLELNKLASIDNIERISGVDFPDYKVIKKKKLWGFDGFEHQISLPSNYLSSLVKSKLIMTP